MSINNFKTYSTGEFAKRFGIKKDTLFYYDRIKLFCPAGVSDNGYRYYTTPQLDEFWALQSLRELDVPIKELELYFREPTPEGLGTVAQKQLGKVNAQLKRLQSTRWLLQRIVDISEELKNATMGELKISELPALPVVYSRPNTLEDETTDEQWEEYYDDFLREMGIKGTGYIGSVLLREDILRGQFGRVGRLFVQMDGASSGQRPAGLYAVRYHQGSYRSVRLEYPSMLEELKRRGYEVCGDVYEEYLRDTLSAKSEDDFVTKVTLRVG